MEKKQIITLDTDGVIYDYYTPWIELLNKEKHTSFTLDDWTVRDGKHFFSSEKEWNDFWFRIFHDEKFYRNIKLYSNEIPYLINMLRKKRAVNIATARSCCDMEPKHQIQRLTLESFLKDSIIVDHFFFEQDKNSVLSGSSYFVEDSFSTAKKAKERFPDIFVYLVTRPWNRDFNAKEYGLIRTSSFEEFARTLLSN